MDHKKLAAMGGKARWQGKTKEQIRSEMMKLVEARRAKKKGSNEQPKQDNV